MSFFFFLKFCVHTSIRSQRLIELGEDERRTESRRMKDRLYLCTDMIHLLATTQTRRDFNCCYLLLRIKGTNGYSTPEDMKVVLFVIGERGAGYRYLRPFFSTFLQKPSRDKVIDFSLGNDQIQQRYGIAISSVISLRKFYSVFRLIKCMTEECGNTFGTRTFT